MVTKYLPSQGMLIRVPCAISRLRSPMSIRTPIWESGSLLRRRSEEHTSELQSHSDLVCRLLLEKKKNLIAAAAGDDPVASDALVELCQIYWRLFFFNDTATAQIYALSLHDALPIRELAPP